RVPRQGHGPFRAFARGVAGRQRGVPHAHLSRRRDAATVIDDRLAVDRGRAVSASVRIDGGKLSHLPGTAPPDPQKPPRPRHADSGRDASKAPTRHGGDRRRGHQRRGRRCPMTAMESWQTRRGFLSPFEVQPPPGAEGWERLYRYYYVFSEPRREFEERKFWF